jgi:DNA invertase Pin-like site-specific DNA recombinase
MILRAGLMKRVSTEEQANYGDSLQAQEEALVAYCEANNIKIVKIYSDEGFSARKPVLKRPAMLELIEDVKAGKLDIILFTKLDRWFRNVKEYHKIQEILERHKVVWKAILEDYNTATADGRLKVNIMLSVAENEADRTSERIKFVFQSKIMRKEAIIPSQNAPFGYKIVKIDGVRKFVKDDETREATEFFFKTALLSSARQAAIKTNQTFGLNRTYKSYNLMCHNEIYAGVYYGVEDYCEPYITMAQHKALSDFSVTTRKAKHNRYYLFSGLIKCNCCGNTMAGRYCTSARGVEYYYYRCRRTLTKACPSTSIAEKKIEKYLLENF